VKKILCTALALTVPGLLMSCTSTDSSDSSGEDVLVVSGYGAEYEELFMDVVGDPFTEATGIEIEYDPTGSASEHYAAIRASGGEPGFDVTVLTSVELYQGKEDGLLAPVTEEEVPNLANLPDELVEAANGSGVVHEVQQAVLMYNEKQFTEPPDSWSVLYDDTAKKGSIIWNPANILGVYQIVTAAELAGGSIEDTDPGFELIAGAADDAIATPEASSEAVPYMEKKSASAFPFWDGRAAIYAESTDYDYTSPKEGTYALLGALGVPSGAEHKSEAYEFMDFWLSPEIQEAWALAYNVGPSISGLTFPEDFAAAHVTTPEQLAGLKIADPKIVVERRTEWAEQWQEAVG
jgi:spermidine/putrescine-binding protein